MRIAIGARAFIALGATLVAGLHAPTTSAESSRILNGISQGSVFGVSQGSVSSSVNNGSVAGISQGSVHGISQGSVHGISQGSVHGISQGSVHGISQGSVHGISQGSVHGISQGSVHGISQGSVHGISQGSVQSSVVLSGPIESVDLNNGVFTSLGQTVMASHDMLTSISLGDMVSVTGSVAGPGWLYADAIEIAGSGYVPGATEIFVSGIPSGIDRSLGLIQLGGLSIDYTAALSSGAIPSGAMLGFQGIQPSSQGVFVTDAVSAE